MNLLIGPLRIRSHRIDDTRGTFQETFRRSAFESIGVNEIWVQDNQVLTHRCGTVRGLHFQAPPHAQAKLVRVVRGAIADVIVDLRASSNTYGMYELIHLNEGDGVQLYVPVGFAHGYCTLMDNTEVSYKTSFQYAPQSEDGIRWNDPTISIIWPCSDVEVNARDKNWRDFATFVTPF